MRREIEIRSRWNTEKKERKELKWRIIREIEVRGRETDDERRENEEGRGTTRRERGEEKKRRRKR